MNNYAAYVGGV